jgi:Na+-transporting NADH:ubiquinone oxidoreductase subunit NqrD
MYAIVILETMLVLYFVYELRQFRLLLALAIGPRLVQSLELHYGATVSPTASTQTADVAQISKFVSMIAELIPVDVTLLALVIIIVLIAITLLVRHCYLHRLSKPQAYLCVQIGNVQNCVNLEWAQGIVLL